MTDWEQSGADATVAEALTGTLTAVDAGDGAAAGELLPLVYELLRRRAGQLMAAERPDHTLTPTALVHEAYLRVADRRSGFEGRRHFYNAAAQAMRRILVENARSRGRAKRGGADGAPASRADDVTVDSLEAQHPVTSDGFDWLALDEALDALRERDGRRHQVVMLRFFAGLGEAEVAELLGVDVRTVRRDWVTAKLWLCAHLSGDPKAA